MAQPEKPKGTEGQKEVTEEAPSQPREIVNQTRGTLEDVAKPSYVTKKTPEECLEKIIKAIRDKTENRKGKPVFSTGIDNLWEVWQKHLPSTGCWNCNTAYGKAYSALSSFVAESLAQAGFNDYNKSAFFEADPEALIRVFTEVYLGNKGRELIHTMNTSNPNENKNVVERIRQTAPEQHEQLALTLIQEGNPNAVVDHMLDFNNTDRIRIARALEEADQITLVLSNLRYFPGLKFGDLEAKRMIGIGASWAFSYWANVFEGLSYETILLWARDCARFPLQVFSDALERHLESSGLNENQKNEILSESKKNQRKRFA